jgi:hypothetical protein
MPDMKIEPNAQTINALVDAMGAIVKSLVATLPPAQQEVFLLKMMECVESAEHKEDDLLNSLLQTLVEAGVTEKRPKPRPGA